MTGLIALAIGIGLEGGFLSGNLAGVMKAHNPEAINNDIKGLKDVFQRGVDILWKQGLRSGNNVSLGGRDENGNIVAFTGNPSDEGTLGTDEFAKATIDQDMRKAEDVWAHYSSRAAELGLTGLITTAVGLLTFGSPVLTIGTLLATQVGTALLGPSAKIRIARLFRTESADPNFQIAQNSSPFSGLIGSALSEDTSLAELVNAPISEITKELQDPKDYNIAKIAAVLDKWEELTSDIPGLSFISNTAGFFKNRLVVSA